MRELINKADMPAPRLEFVWRKTRKTWKVRECDYNLVLPLRKHDIRREREHEDGTPYNVDELVLHIGTTTVEGGLDKEPITDGCIEVPFRDGAHANWDSEALHGLPIYAVVGDVAQKVI